MTSTLLELATGRAVPARRRELVGRRGRAVAARDGSSSSSMASSNYGGGGGVRRAMGVWESGVSDPAYACDV
uniref:Uncharacterized protein n=1 Tax=Arundo donax TaxID=35708 RepID=A0A0A9FF40_ARUDO